MAHFRSLNDTIATHTPNDTLSVEALPATAVGGHACGTIGEMAPRLVIRVRAGEARRAEKTPRPARGGGVDGAGRWVEAQISTIGDTERLFRLAATLSAHGCGAGSDRQERLLAGKWSGDRGFGCWLAVAWK